MNISTKSYIGTGVFGVLIIVMGLVSLWGNSRLSAIIDYIIGPAWSTADGAMESTIGVQSQLRFTALYLSGDKGSLPQITAAREMTDSAMQAIFSAKIIPQQQLDQMQHLQKNYQQAQVATIEAYNQYQTVLLTFKSHTQEFVALGELLEEHGDKSVEELENNPNRSITWDSGLRDKWAAADGGMEANIGYLTTLYHVERYLGLPPSEAILDNINSAIKFQQSASEEMFSTNFFDISAPAPYSGTLKNTYQQYFAQHQDNVKNLVVSYQKYFNLHNQYLAVASALIDFMGEFEEVGDAAVESQNENVITTQKTVSWIIGTTLFVAIILTAAVIFLIKLFLTAPIQKVIEATFDIASGEGDLTKRLDISTKDELGRLSGNFDLFLSKLHQTIGQTQNATFEISEVIEKSNENIYSVSQNIEDVNELSAQVATANKQMQSSSLEIAKNCNKAFEAANNAKQLSQGGLQVVIDVDKGMQKVTHAVSSSSKRISTLKQQADRIDQIISVITGISEQTNLLALNAAIEAARAGEQGRGFAVVADEVRTLAQRTAESTKEIASVIEIIQSETNNAFQAMELCELEVANNSTKSKEAEETLEVISKNINELTSLVNQIAVAAEQQTVTLLEISESSQSINSRISDVAELTQTSRDYAAKMQGSTKEVSLIMAQFKL